MVLAERVAAFPPTPAAVRRDGGGITMLAAVGRDTAVFEHCVGGFFPVKNAELSGIVATSLNRQQRRWRRLCDGFHIRAQAVENQKRNGVVAVTGDVFTVVEDFADFLVVDKAPGISVHKDRNCRGFLENVTESTGCERLYLVHRLDRMTSGLLLLAKNARSCAALAGLFARRRMEKYYVALSDAKPNKKQGLVRGDMERSRNGAWKLSRTRTDPATTRFFSSSVSPGLRLFVLRPETGKTHQLRVAMKSLGAPILGDARYGGADADRGYLHAYALRFEYGGKPVTLQSAPGRGERFEQPDVRAALRRVDAPWLLPWSGPTPSSNDV